MKLQNSQLNPNLNGSTSAIQLVQFLQNEKEKDNEFVYSLRFDDLGNIQSIFWMNQEQKKLLSLYNDVILLDTTAGLFSLIYFL